MRLFLLFFAWVAVGSAQLTGASPTAITVSLVQGNSNTGIGPFGPASQIVLTGSGMWSVGGATTCFSYTHSGVGVLPETIWLRVTWPAASTCNFVFVGASGGSVTVTVTVQRMPKALEYVATDYHGNLLADIGCVRDNTTWRFPYNCPVSAGQKRPGGAFTPPTVGQSYVDDRFGAPVTVQNATGEDSFTRVYSQAMNISYDGLYHLQADRAQHTRIVAHRLDALDTAQDYNISGTTGTNICDQDNSQTVFFDQSQNRGWCQKANGDWIEFKLETPPNPTVVGTVHQHPGGAIGSGAAAADGGLFHFDSTQICFTKLGVPNFQEVCTPHFYDTATVNVDTDILTLRGGQTPHIFSANSFSVYFTTTGTMPSPLVAGTKYWVKAVPSSTTLQLATSAGGALVNLTSAGTGELRIHYTPRNLGTAPHPTKRGKYYAVMGGDNPDNALFYVYDSRTHTIALSGYWMKQNDAPGVNSAQGTWSNGIANGSDTIAGGHHGEFFFNGAAWSCGPGRGTVTKPSYWGGSSCLRFDANYANALDLEETGGPLRVGPFVFTSYMISAGLAPVAVSTQPTNSQGGKAAWPISSCVGDGQEITCTITNNLNSSGIRDLETTVQVDGVRGMSGSIDGRSVTVVSHDATTFTFAGTETGTSTSNTGSMTLDTFPTSSAIRSGVMVVRMDTGQVKFIADTKTVSYGPALSGARGAWQGININAPGYEALSFVTISPTGDKVCWNTNFGYTEKLFVACAPTGWDLDKNTQSHHFDRWGRGVYTSRITATGVEVNIKPTNPTYHCSVAVHENPDFSDPAVVEAESSSGSTRTHMLEGLTEHTQYFMKARCAPSEAQIVDYSIRLFKTL